MIENIFPTTVGIEWFKDHSEYEEYLATRCFELEKTIDRGEPWLQNNTYNTMGSYDISKDWDFDPITDFVKESVRDYWEYLGLSPKVLSFKPRKPWFNIYRKGDFQDYHYHANTLVTCVYFLKANPTIGAKLFLKSPITDFLSPTIQEHKLENHDRVFYSPDPGKLVMMRGYVQHAVEHHGDDEPRISLIYNFVRKDNK